MKAVVYDEYGPPEVLKLREVDMPVPQDDEVLVRVHAASVNQWDWDFVRANPSWCDSAGSGNRNTPFWAPISRESLRRSAETSPGFGPAMRSWGHLG